MSSRKRKRLSTNYKQKDSDSDVPKDEKFKVDEATEEEEKGIVLPVLKVVDKERQLHCYSSVLNRTEPDMVGIEEVDRLQLELETMLSAVVIRTRALREDIELIAAAEEQKPKKSSVLTVIKPKKATSENVRSCEDSSNSKPSASKNVAAVAEESSDSDDGPAESESILDRPLPRRTLPLVPPSVVPIAKNDITNKFWSSVETYCSNITNEDIKFLEERLAWYNDRLECGLEVAPTVEPCTSELLTNKRNDSAPSSPVAGPSGEAKDNTTDEIDDPTNMHLQDDTVSEYIGPGSLTKKVASVLIERPGMSNGGHREDVSRHRMKKKFRSSDSFFSSATSFSEIQEKIRTIPSLHTSVCLEKRVRDQLISSGLFRPPETPYKEDENKDFVLSELYQCRDELRTVWEQNRDVISRLLQCAKTDMIRQNIKEHLKVLDSEIADIGLSNLSSRLKKKVYTKKETDHAWKLLKQREQLLTQLEETQ